MSIASFVADPSERARWRALDALFALIRQSAAVVWEGSTSEGILSVKPQSVCEGWHGRDSCSPAAAFGERHLVLGGQFPRGSRAKKAKVVFASATAPSVAAKAASVNQNTGVIRVELPAHTQAGWVGVTSSKLVAESNKSRGQLREFWSAQNKSNPALARSPVPVAAIAMLRRCSDRRLECRETVSPAAFRSIELFAIDPKVRGGRFGCVASLAGGWRRSRDDRIQSVSFTIPAAPVCMFRSGRAVLQAQLTAVNACGQTTASSRRSCAASASRTFRCAYPDHSSHRMKVPPRASLRGSVGAERCDGTAIGRPRPNSRCIGITTWFRRRYLQRASRDSSQGACECLSIAMRRTTNNGSARSTLRPGPPARGRRATCGVDAGVRAHLD